MRFGNHRPFTAVRMSRIYHSDNTRGQRQQKVGSRGNS
ncbi:hypothetical protein VL20_4329 [Microcystis panniformis FACHB-1757]|uniref:Uncharacterized protein n=1 Tax=Microcystis panniformis FACHB-1757 TaxID=1638788 RepID=A0A0K1S5H8_9CHRO|nr:hypothetical protein VL20_4329 [Microcystis panniformis FACHB-1757]